MYQQPFYYLIILFMCSDGIKPPPDVVTVKYDDIADKLQTGDLVLFSGATSSGAIIKLFDNAEFSHIGLVRTGLQTCKYV